LTCNDTDRRILGATRRHRRHCSRWLPKEQAPRAMAAPVQPRAYQCHRGRDAAADATARQASGRLRRRDLRPAPDHRAPDRGTRPACWPYGIARKMAGNRPRPGQRYQEHRPPVRAVPALCACPGTQVAPPPRPPRDHGADGAAARQIPAPQHPERPAGGTRPRAGEGSDASRRPCFRRSDGTPAAHRSRPGS
jgi:hypothetical protein